jgi:uncharacterized membrane protein
MKCAIATAAWAAMARVFCLALLGLAPSLPMFAQEFRYVSFDIPGCSRGQIVGLCLDANGAHGFLLDLTTGHSELIDYPGATFTAAADINARGEVVGPWNDSNGLRHGYRRDVNGDFHVVDPPASSACIISNLPNVPHGINDLGDIVGRCFDASENEHGFVRWRDGRFELIDYPGSSTSDAWVITNTEKVIGGDYSDTAGFVHGFTWTRSGGFQSVDFPGAPDSAVRTVAENGAVTGIYFDGNTLHGFLLPDLTVDYPGSISNAGTLVINNSGLIVGGYDDANGGEHGFVAIRTVPSAK